MESKRDWRINQPLILKVAAMFVAAPRYVGLMLFLSGFVFSGTFLDALHVAEAVAGVALAVLEGFALAYILSRRQLGFSDIDKKFIVAVVGVLLILLPLCAAPYLLYLFDGSRLFEGSTTNFVMLVKQAGLGVAILKFCWAAATASMPILIIVGVALVEKDPVDVQLLNAERKALLQQRLAEIEAETEQKVLHFKLLAQQARTERKQRTQQAATESGQPQQDANKAFLCRLCGNSFDSAKALAGHTGHCKARTETGVANKRLERNGTGAQQ